MRKFTEILVETRSLTKHFPVETGLLSRFLGARKIVHAVCESSLHIHRGETMGLVGESGCGKTTLGRCILQLIPPTSGEVYFEGHELTRLKDEELRSFRRKMQIIFQDAYSSLNPRKNIGVIVGHAMDLHEICGKGEVKERTADLLDTVGLGRQSFNRYPHQFSGGQRQRIAIARALAVKPSFIVADEPVSALDVSIQAQILNLLKELKDRFSLTYLFITHDLSVVEHVSDRVAVMYLGRIVEVASVEEVFTAPMHPYTKALLSAVPIPDPNVKRERVILTGDVPSPVDLPSGCRFHTRCPQAGERCRREEPELRDVGYGHAVACHYAG